MNSDGYFEKNVFDVELGEISVIHGPMYLGPYSVTPNFAQQTLETTGKTMSQSVKIREIPYSEVVSPSGGIIINIGG